MASDITFGDIAEVDIILDISILSESVIVTLRVFHSVIVRRVDTRNEIDSPFFKCSLPVVPINVKETEIAEKDIIGAGFPRIRDNRIKRIYLMIRLIDRRHPAGSYLSDHKRLYTIETLEVCSETIDNFFVVNAQKRITGKI